MWHHSIPNIFILILKSSYTWCLMFFYCERQHLFFNHLHGCMINEFHKMNVPVYKITWLNIRLTSLLLHRMATCCCWRGEGWGTVTEYPEAKNKYNCEPFVSEKECTKTETKSTHIQHIHLAHLIGSRAKDSLRETFYCDLKQNLKKMKFWLKNQHIKQ